jgi:uncharacterized protein YkwD
MSSPVGDEYMDRGTRTEVAPPRRTNFLLSGVAVLAVLVGGSLYLGRGVFSAPAPGTLAGSPAGCAMVSCAAGAADLAVAVPPAVVTIPPRQLAAGSSRTSSASSRTSSRATGAAAGTASAQPAASAAATPSAAADGTAAAQVLALINQARATAGLPALTVTAGLQSSSAAHNQLMAGGCGLSHQCPGEASLGARETAAGVIWTAAGENIGEGGPVADTGAAIAQLAVSLTQSMLNEQPPNDGHRMNILSSTFTHIGIAVYRDSAGTVWLTQDFSN